MPHRLNAILASNQELRRLSGKAGQLSALQRHYEAIAPPSLKLGSQILQLHQQTVVIAAYSGAVAAKLRQMTTELISLFQARGCEVTGIQIKVQVRVSPRIQVTAPRKLGKAARKALGELQDDLADSPLKAALGRLIRRS
ncbi:MAG: DUF721 domain-containing protein [Nitrosomonadales bacterium]|nr:DUF721 domain-containing protein [Nitrosomonadales bacterium]